MTKQITAKNISWDLSDLYQGMDDEKIKQDKQAVTDTVADFVKSYKGRLEHKNLTAMTLVSALRDYANILEQLYVYGTFSSLIKSKDTASAEIAKFDQAAKEFINDLSASLLFFELELVAISENKINELIKDEELAKLAHYIKHERVFKPYRLKEGEEVIMTKKSQSGAGALVRFYDELNSNLKYSLNVDGEEKQLNYSQLATILANHPDRELRKAAAQALTKGLDQKKKDFTFLYNTLLLDKKINDEIRGYKDPRTATFLSYEIKEKTVDELVETVTNNYNLVEEFYQTKANLIGDELFEWDRYNDVFTDVEQKRYSWEQAKAIILEAFAEFDPEFAKVATMFFEKNWIDAEVTEGKVGGAFCSYAVPSVHPYILVNFEGELRDVTTLAHELGHGIHAYLSREQNILQFWPSTATAEIASVFCEMLVFDKLYKQLDDTKLKLNLLGSKIQESFATIFRQTSFYLFEKDSHERRRTSGELEVSELNTIFQDRVQAMFGKGLHLTEDHAGWWMPVQHFFRYNFYVFTYAMGEALTKALFAIYQEQGSSFVKQYKQALALGGSCDPYEITSVMGVDINRKDFWQEGIDLLGEYIQEYKTLAASIN